MRQANLIQYPPPPKRPPPDSDPGKWCEYHRSIGHLTDDCRTLRKEVERLIKEGHLGKFIHKSQDGRPNISRTPNPDDSSQPPPVTGENAIALGGGAPGDDEVIICAIAGHFL